MDKIKKRNGTYAAFDPAKIQTAIMKANVRVAEEPMTEEDLSFLTQRVVKKLEKENEIPDVEHIQDIVERTLSKAGYSRTAKAYILYRAEHAKMREMRDTLPEIFSNLTFKAASEVDMKRENANINTDTAMGTMLKFGTESAKDYFDKFILPPHITQADHDGDIHIHDKDFYTITETCCQIDLLKLFKDGFSTGHGYLREPNSIRSYAALACIAIQANQNEMHGGQAVPNFDYAMADGVRKTYRKSFLKHLAETLENKGIWPIGTGYQKLKKMNLNVPTLGQANEQKWPNVFDNKIHEALDTYGILVDEDYRHIARRAYTDTVDETHQAMEAVIHNLNTLHARAGAQVPFSSINYGTDTSPEGQLAIREILNATDEGMGNGETPIFPVQIFKVKEGVNYNPDDPNYSLFKQAMRVSAKRLFPNFSFMDAPFNKQYLGKHPDKPWYDEVGYMGCRTRVMANVYDPENEITPGRGNLSFTSINLPRIAIQSRNLVNEKGEFNSPTNMEKFYRILDERIDLCIEQLLHRFKIQCSKHVYNYPFLMGEGVWINSEKLKPNDTVGELLKHGTLSVGFIGLAETLIALTGKHHGESEESWKLGYEIIKYMRERMDQACKKYRLNLSLLATPGEGLCIAGDTPVHAANGLKPIKDVKPGDTLITFNEKTNRFEPDIVVKSGMTGKRTDILQITFDDNTVVTCTANHPFAVVQNNGILWVHATNLIPGSTIKSKNGNRRVTKTETLDVEIEVYDVTMAHNHNFLVGENEGILVHNSGTFIRIDKKKYGIIPGVTDREYYTNSFHVPVYYNISAFDKIKKEAPFHELTNAGHISYVEVDGDIAKNLDAFEAIIRCMKESGIGYGSINHPVDRDPICGYVGIINEVCPRCGRRENEAVSLEKLEELKKKYRNMPDITKYIK